MVLLIHVLKPQRACRLLEMGKVESPLIWNLSHHPQVSKAWAFGAISDSSTAECEGPQPVLACGQLLTAPVIWYNARYVPWPQMCRWPREASGRGV